MLITVHKAGKIANTNSYFKYAIDKPYSTKLYLIGSDVDGLPVLVRSDPLAHPQDPHPPLHSGHSAPVLKSRGVGRLLSRIKSCNNQETSGLTVSS